MIYCRLRLNGALAQLVARDIRIVEVRGSTPLCSTKIGRTQCPAIFLWHGRLTPDRRQCDALERESRLRPPVEEISQAAFSTDKEWISTMWSHDYIGCGTGVRLLAVVGCSPLCHTPQRALIYKDRSFFVFGQCSDFCIFGFMIALYALICKARRHLTGTL